MSRPEEDINAADGSGESQSEVVSDDATGLIPIIGRGRIESVQWSDGRPLDAAEVVIVEFGQSEK